MEAGGEEERVCIKKVTPKNTLCIKERKPTKNPQLLQKFYLLPEALNGNAKGRVFVDHVLNFSS